MAQRPAREEVEPPAEVVVCRPSRRAAQPGGVAARGTGAEEVVAARGADVVAGAARGASGVVVEAGAVRGTSDVVVGAGAVRGTSVEADEDEAACGAGVGVALGKGHSGTRGGVGTTDELGAAASPGGPAVDELEEPESWGPIGKTETSWLLGRKSSSLVGRVLERGNEFSSKMTCLEMRIRLVERSRHL